MTCTFGSQSCRPDLEAMSHEERIAYATNLQCMAAVYIIVAAAIFAGLTGGLWHLMGSSALATAFGSSAFCWIMGAIKCKRAMTALALDAALLEREQATTGPKAEPDV